ncbi:glycosyltransferase [Hyphomonas sp.]|uniref:glycosyltransferase n=1 Tax=Hyphomonas sp. TaxID=87 RepID=UPI001BCB1462|nr:glycosyltransferase [Hyphomonas sp.]
MMKKLVRKPTVDNLDAVAGAHSQQPPEHSLKLAYFAGDATNPTVRLRIRSFMRNAVNVIGFTFRRDKFHTDFVPFWENIELGRTKDRNYLQRLGAILLALGPIWRNRAQLRDVDVLYARLFDAAFLALLARYLLRLDAKLVYEIEDVQQIFFRKSVAAEVFRFLERRILASADLVVLPSPGFAEGYLQPIQGYDRPYFLLENRIQLDEIPLNDAPPSARAQKWRQETDRWVIGWFGTLRCPKSMRLLSEIADRLGDRVLIYTRGYPTETGLDAYMEIVNRHPNWIYEGPYMMPDDLEDIYGRVHFVWCLDFLDERGNSELLLACRMYHGGYFGALPIVASQSQMARHLSPHGIGHPVSAPYVDDVCSLIEGMTPARYYAEREAVLTRRDELFLEDGSGTRALLERIAGK